MLCCNFVAVKPLISFAGLLTLLWVIHLNVGYNDIFSAMDTGSVVVSTLHTRETHHILITFFKICIVIIPRYMLWVFPNILS